MDLSDKNDLLWLSELVRDLRQAAPAHEALIVGAMARDLLLHYGSGVRVTRATTDVDLAFAVADWEEFNALRQALIDSRSFTPSPSATHKLVHRERLAIDLIPFGEVEDAAGQILWPADESLMSVLGYREAHATGVELLLPGGQRIRAVSLPMLATLKVIAWAERHTTQPRKDAADLFLVLRNYLSQGNSERLYSEAPHLLESDAFDYDVAGAWLAGRDAAAAIMSASAEPERLLKAVWDVLVSEADPDGPLHLVGESGSDAQLTLRLLQGFRDGLSAGQ